MKSRFVLALLAFSSLTVPALAADKLIIVSPHRKSIQDEFIPAFKKYYQAKFKTSVDVDWLDQGGTSDDVRFLRAKFATTPKTAGVDVFWGGGSSVYSDLAAEKLFASYKLPAELQKEVPASVAGVPLHGDHNSWHGAALSSFGIFYNVKLLKMQGLKTPSTWQDLASADYRDQLSLADPRRSGSYSFVNTLILQSNGWDKGWTILTEIAANTRQFTQSSSDPIKAVVSGDAAASTAIDFYALAKIGDLGKENLGFTVPTGQAVIDPDPVAILKGAPHEKVAERFVDFILSAPEQAVLMLPKGAAGGPVSATQGRMAVNTKAYELTEGRRVLALNPFKAKTFFKVDTKKAAKLESPLNDLIGATLIDTHDDLVAAWNRVIKDGSKPAAVAALTRPFVSEAELLQLAGKWNNNVLRNQTINKWVDAARKRYRAIAAGSVNG